MTKFPPPPKNFVILFIIWFEMYFGIPCDTHLEILQYMYNCKFIRKFYKKNNQQLYFYQSVFHAKCSFFFHFVSIICALDIKRWKKPESCLDRGDSRIEEGLLYSRKKTFFVVVQKGISL